MREKRNCPTQAKRKRFERENEKWVNWEKMSDIGKSISEVNRFTVKYTYPDTNEHFVDYFSSVDVWENEDICWEIGQLRNKLTEFFLII